jgi:hypothetical protein
LISLNVSTLSRAVEQSPTSINSVDQSENAEFEAHSFALHAWTVEQDGIVGRWPGLSSLGERVDTDARIRARVAVRTFSSAQLALQQTNELWCARSARTITLVGS